MAPRIHPELLAAAEWRLASEKQATATKEAFTPAAGGDPAAAAAPPMDPMAGGGAPPMDPMAGAGGMPPMDPAAMGGGAGAAGPMPPEIQMAIDQAVQGAMAGAGGGAAAPAAGGGGGAGGAKKLDPVMIYLEMGRIRKLLVNLHQHTNIPLPEDILDDNMVAQAVAGVGPQSQPIGQEGGGAAAPAPPPPGAGGAIPGIGQSPPIAPIEPAKMAAAGTPAEIVMGMPVPQDASPAEQTDVAAHRIDALSHLSRSLRNGT